MILPEFFSILLDATLRASIEFGPFRESNDPRYRQICDWDVYQYYEPF